MTKWTLLSTPFFMLFLHRFRGPDWSRDPHDHPADFISIGLFGSYVETVYDRDGNVLYERKWIAPWVRSFSAAHVHRTSAVGSYGAYTLCFASAVKQNWGFFIGGQRVTWRSYLRTFRSQRSDSRAATNTRNMAEQEAQHKAAQETTATTAEANGGDPSVCKS